LHLALELRGHQGKDMMVLPVSIQETTLAVVVVEQALMALLVLLGELAVRGILKP
jgi:hypothetical protein